MAIRSLGDINSAFDEGRFHVQRFVKNAGSVASLTGVSDLRGILSMSGEWTPFTELSPEGLAKAVWNSLLAQYQVDGTAGKALSAAGSGGVDYSALANAVWTNVTRTLTEGAAPTPEDVAVAVLEAIQTASPPIPVNVEQMNSTEVIGIGREADKWRGVGEPNV